MAVIPVDIAGRPYEVQVGSGLLPRLVAEGYNGPIWSTPATRDLCTIMLEDSARIQEYDFEFDLKFDVVEYRVTMVVNGAPKENMVKGAAVSGEVREMFQKAKPGQKVWIEGSKARGPDGTVRNLGGLSFKVV